MQTTHVKISMASLIIYGITAHRTQPSSHQYLLMMQILAKYNVRQFNVFLLSFQTFDTSSLLFCAVFVIKHLFHYFTFTFRRNGIVAWKIFLQFKLWNWVWNELAKDSNGDDITMHGCYAMSSSLSLKFHERILSVGEFLCALDSWLNNWFNTS